MRHPPPSQFRHGLTNHPVFAVWASMKQRCHNPDHKQYPYYGGRGITVCKRWLEKIENFVDDMGLPPKGLTIERKNNNDGYYQENCRWATRVDQARNRRNTRLYEYGGKKLCIAAWAETSECRCTKVQLLNRVLHGWSFAKALTTPSHKPSYISKAGNRWRLRSPTTDRHVGYYDSRISAEKARDLLFGTSQKG